MPIIPTSRGKFVKVCRCHYKLVKGFKWSAFEQGRHSPKKYAAVRQGLVDGRVTTILMHRQIMDFPKGKVIDHKNGDPSNNYCNNLRVCTQSQNNLNQKEPKYNSKSGHKGVYWHKGAKKWCAEVVVEHKKHYLGLFKNKLDAAEAYNKKAQELAGEYFSPA